LIKDNIHNALWTVYDRKGYDSLIHCAWELMLLCESNSYQQSYRQMKGEVAEIVLECGLREIQNIIKPSVVLKGLCIPVLSNNGTTEMDLLSITTRKIYMFECKSYKNKPTITGECMLGDNMNVAEQSKYHLKALNEYISKYYNKVGNEPPYKLVLFEMSSKGVNDKRTEENKKRIPVCNPNTFVKTIALDYRESPKNVWDIDNVVKVLEPLSDNSDNVFKKHLNRMIHKNRK